MLDPGKPRMEGDILKDDILTALLFSRFEIFVFGGIPRR